MPPANAFSESNASRSDNVYSTVTLVLATACLVWYSAIAVVCSIGYVQLWRHNSSPKPRARLEADDTPHVTVIRPVKGLEPRLYDCLASTFLQDYP